MATNTVDVRAKSSVRALDPLDLYDVRSLLTEEERRRFLAWPNRPLAKHWVGNLEGPGRLRMVLISLDPATGA